MGARQSSTSEAIAVFRSKIYGVVMFSEDLTHVHININLKGLPPGKHGFHIHEFGDLRHNCKSACGHYNPQGMKHGDLNNRYSHAGDLGNIIANKQGNCIMKLTTTKFKFAIQDIIGRCLIIHADEDDLSSATESGNSGDRIACEVIGIAMPAGRPLNL